VTAPLATPLVWGKVDPSGSDYAFSQGHRYAVLASVSKNYALDEVHSYMTGHGWTVTYAWEQGQPSRALYPIDTWLQGLAPDTTSNHRWVYGEANRTDVDTTIGVDAPWPLTIYHIADVLEAVPGQPSAAPIVSTLPAPSSRSPFPTTTVAVAGGVGLGLGLLAPMAWRALRAVF
jgi:hypothetical protein